MDETSKQQAWTNAFPALKQELFLIVRREASIGVKRWSVSCCHVISFIDFSGAIKDKHVLKCLAGLNDIEGVLFLQRYLTKTALICSVVPIS